VAEHFIDAPIALEFVELSVDGVPALVDESLATRVAMDLRQLHAFPAVFEPIDFHRAPPGALRLQLSVELLEETHAAANGAKAFATVLSLFLLAPVLHYDRGAEAHASVLARSCDGWSKRFEGEATGSLRHTLFANEPYTDWAMTAGTIERALGGALGQLAADEEIRAATPSCLTSLAP
jgi:hypothetical protein